jgi:glutathione peroxidase
MKTLLLLVATLSLSLASHAQQEKALTPAPSSPLSIPIKDIDGKDTTLGANPAKAVLVINVASQCGYTNQYAGLQAIYDKYKDKGLLVVGVPCNDFGGQEPEGEAAIKAFCTGTYSVSFPLTSKVNITSEPQHPLYLALTKAAGSVDWNFTKFLITENGSKITKYEPDAEPTGEALTAAIEAALAK